MGMIGVVLLLIGSASLVAGIYFVNDQIRWIGLGAKPFDIFSLAFVVLGIVLIIVGVKVFKK
jgi:hypothetical protein